MNTENIKFSNKDEASIDNVEMQEAQQVADEVAGEAVESQQETHTESEVETKIAMLEAALAASEEKVRAQQDEVLRSRADIENMRRRNEQDMDKARKFAIERFANELLPVLDNLERAIELAEKENEALKPMLEGVELTLKTMHDTVAKFGLKVLNPQGEAFDPTYHQAMSIQESTEFAPNTVMMVMQKGYELNGRVVRPAMVMVSKAAAGNVNETA